jgi:hypothetical protein
LAGDGRRSAMQSIGGADHRPGFCKLHKGMNVFKHVSGILNLY